MAPAAVPNIEGHICGGNRMQLLGTFDSEKLCPGMIDKF
jgi:hypothetical protein